MRTRWLSAETLTEQRFVPIAELQHAPAIGFRSVLSTHEAASWAQAVLAASDQLVDDFGGEQQALGRAFYTHLETGAASTYFAQQAASDALVERVLPGMQARTIALLARLVGGVVRRRHGFCGPGVHVFSPGEKVARVGGVYHYDLEGLPLRERQCGVAGGARAVSLVWMLQPAQRRGGLTLFQQQYRGINWDMLRTPKTPSTTTRALAGDALLFSSYRLHRINGFSGDAARISITVHAVEVDRDVWECWF